MEERKGGNAVSSSDQLFRRRCPGFSYPLSTRPALASRIRLGKTDAPCLLHALPPPPAEIDLAGLQTFRRFGAALAKLFGKSFIPRRKRGLRWQNSESKVSLSRIYVQRKICNPRYIKIRHLRLHVSRVINF